MDVPILPGDDAGHLFAIGDAPQPGGVVPRGAGEQFAIGRKSDGVDGAGVAVEGADLAAGGASQRWISLVWVPPARSVPSGEKARQTTWTLSPWRQLPAGGDVPQPDGEVAAGGGDDLAVRGDGEGRDALGVVREPADFRRRTWGRGT